MNLDNNRNIDIYVDQINVITFVIILFKFSRKKIHRIFYDSYRLPKFLNFFWKQIKIKNINKIPASRFKLDSKFFYGFHWDKIDEFLKSSFSEESVYNENSKFLKKNQIDLEKYLRHLRDQSIIHSYLPIKLILISKKFSRKKNVIYIMSNNPLKNFLENFFKIKINSYLNLFNHTLKRDIGWSKNPQYIAYHINFISPKLYRFKKIIYFLIVCLRGILIKNKSDGSKKICIELHQREIKLNEITDFYWAKHSKIKKENIITFSYKKWDKDSLNVLKNFGIKNDYNAYKLPISLKDFIKIILLTPKLFFFLFKYNSYDGWKKFNRIFFLSKLKYYNSLYQTFNINFVFSMADLDDDKFIKLQAIKNNDGLSSFSHWSNFNFKQNIYHKCCDIFFTWSKHFTETFFNEYSYQKVYYVGYPNDHYFKDIVNHREKEKYIIGYMDNIFNNDLPYHISHIKSVFRMFFKLLKKYPNLLIYTKPKTKYHYQKLIESSDEMRKFVKEGRIVSFFGEGYNVKMSPAKFSSKCNLVLSQGISSAGAEVGFYGIKSFHYDNMDLENYNGFSKISQNKVVFKNINNLKMAFEREIENPNNNTDESKKCHSILNPFKENKCGERTALIIDTIYQNFDGLKNINKTLNIVNQAIEKNHNLFKSDHNYKY